MLCASLNCENHTKTRYQRFCCISCAVRTTRPKPPQRYCACGVPIRDPETQQCRKCLSNTGLPDDWESMLPLIREYRERRVPIVTIAAKLSVPVQMIRRLAKRFHILRATSPLPKPTCAECGKALPDRRKLRCRPCEYERRRRERADDPRVLRVEELREEGCTNQQIANELGFKNARSIRMLVQKLDLPRRQTAPAKPRIRVKKQPKPKPPSDVVRLPLRELYRHGYALYAAGDLPASKRTDVDAICKVMQRQDPQGRRHRLLDNRAF